MKEKLLLYRLLFVIVSFLQVSISNAQETKSQAVCPNATEINIGKSGGFDQNGTWVKVGDPTFTGFASQTKTTTVRNLDLGDNVLIYTDTKGATLTETVTNYKVFAGDNQSICSAGASNSVELDGSNPNGLGTGVWTIQSGDPTKVQILDPSAYNTGVNFTATGSFTFRWTITYTPALTCEGTPYASSYAEMTVNIAGPAVAIAGIPAGPVCPGQSVTLTASGGGTYLWNTGATTASITVTPNVSTNYSVNVTSGGCVSVGTANITVNSIFSLSSLANGYCVGQPGVTLTLSGSENGVSYQVQKNAVNDGAAVAGNGAAITWNNKTAGTYTVVATNIAAGCSMTMGNVTIVENPLPIVNAGADITGCEGNSFTLTASGASTYVWNTGATTSSVTVSPTSTTTYSVTGTVTATGCFGSDNVDVIVNTLPSKYSVTGTGNYCQGTGGLTIQLSDTEGPAVTYQLLKNGLAEGVSVAGTGGAINWANKTAGSYTVLADNGNCVTSMNGSAVITEIALPTVFSLSGPTSYCSGVNGVTLTLSGSQVGVNYTLKKAGAAVGTIAGTGAAISWPNVLTGSYTVDAVTTIPLACPVSMNGTVIVNEVALPVVNAGPDAAICFGSSTQLQATGADTYVWDQVGTLNDPLISNPVATPSSTTLYTVTGTDVKGCVDTDQVQVTVRSLPNAVASTPTTICNGDKAILTATDNINGNNETYLWSTGSTNDTIIVYPSTNTTYFVTITDVFGCQNSTSTTVTVNLKPGVNAGSDTEICAGSTVTLNGNGDANTWLWSNGSTTLTTNVSPAITTDYVLKGTYTVTGCYTIDTVKVTVNNLPATSFTLDGAGITQFCSNGNLVTLAGNPAGGLFSSSAAGAVSGNFFNPVTAGLGTHSITYTYTDAKWCTGTNTLSVDVIAPPVVSITGLNASYCNTDAPFSVAGNPLHNGSLVYGTFALTGPAAIPAGTLTPGNGTCTIDPSKLTVEGNYTLTYQVANSAGCVNNFSQSFALRLGPSLDFVGLPASICPNTSAITLTGNQGANGNFAGSGITDNNNGTALFNPALVPANYNISFSFTNANGCAASVTQTVAVVDVPVVFAVTGGGDYCSGGGGMPVGLSDSENGIDYELYLNGVSTGDILPGTGIAINFGNRTSAGTYTIWAKNPATNCRSLMNGSAIITQIASPADYVLTGPSIYCSGTNGVSLSLSGSQLNVDYTLKKGIAFIETKPGTGLPVSWDNLTAGTYTVEAVNTSSLACAVTMSGTINVAAVAIPNASAGSDEVICLGGSKQLIASGGVSYSWSPATGLSSTSVSNPVASPASTQTYVVAVTDNNGCTDNDTVIVEVKSIPNITVSPNVSVCKGDQVTLTVSDNITGSKTYNWSTGSTKDTTIVRPSTQTTYTVTVTDSWGCSASGNTMVSVNPKPSISAGSDIETCIGTPVTLTGTGNADSWLWSNGSTNNSTNVNPAFTTDYILRGTNNLGCFVQDTVKVIVNNLPVVSFTLNGGMNTTFCSNGALVNLSGTPANGTFSSLTAGGAIAGDKFDPVAAGLGTHTIVYTYTDPKGCSASSSVNVDIVAPPNVTVTGVNASYCSNGTPFTVTGNPLQDGNGLFGTWTFSGPGIAMIDNGNGTCTIDPTKILVEGNYNLTYRVSSSLGCFNTDTKTFALNGAPTVNFVGLPAAICKNSPVALLTGNQGVEGFFSGMGITINGNGTATFDPSGLMPASYNISFTYTNLINSCSASKTFSVVVNDVPVQYSLTGGGSYCSGLPGVAVGLSDSEADVIYELFRDGFTTGIVVAGTGNAISFGDQTLAGNYTVTGKKNGILCTLDMLGSASVTVLFKPLDAQIITGPNTVCPGSTENYTVPAMANATSYVWQLPANATITSGNGTTNISVAFAGNAASGNITVYGQNICGTSASSSYPLTVKALPIAAGVISGDQTVCQNDINVVYTVPVIANATSYLWTAPSGATIVSGQGTETIVVNYGSSSLSGNVSVKGVNSCGNGGLSILPVSVSPTPQLTINAPSGQITCSVPNVTVSATSSTAGAAYLWTAIDGGNIPGINTNSSAIANSAGQYIVAVTANGCVSRDTVTVISDLQAPQDVNIIFTNSGQITCLVPDITLSATTSSAFPVGYQWTASAGGNITSGAGLANAIVNKGGVYEVKVTNLGTGCYATKSFTVTELKNVPDLTVTNPDDEKISCSKTSVNLSATSTTSGVIYAWSGAGIISGGNTSTPLVGATGSFTVTVTAPNGCTSSGNVQVISDNSVPTVSVNTNPADITCTVTSVSLSGSSTTAGATLLWTGPGVVSGANTETPLINLAGVYTLTVTHPLTGCTSSAQVTVDSNTTAPTVTFPVLPPTITCNPSNVTITGVTSAANKTYQWSTLNGTIVSGATTKDVVVSKAGTYTLQVTDTDNGCIGTGSVNAIENVALPGALIAAPGTITCSQPSLQLSGSSPTANPVSILWSTTDGNIVSGGITMTPTINKGGTYELKITSNVNQCYSEASVFVTENKTKPVVSIDKSPATITCAMPAISLNGTAAGATLQWTGPAGSTITNATSPAPQVNKAGRYYLTATTPGGCISKDSTDVTENLVKPANLTIAAPGTLTCSNTSLNLTGSSTTPSSIYKWSGLNGGTIISADNTGTITIGAAGDYKMVVKHPASFCKDSAMVTVLQDLSAPTITFSLTPVAITCNQNTSVLNATVNPAGSALQWTGPGTISNTGITNPTVGAAGNYNLVATHPSTGCITNATIAVPQDRILPDITIAPPETSTCSQPNVSLDATTSVVNYTAQWATANGNIVGASNTIDIIAGKGGLYTLTLTNNDNGCAASQNVLVNYNDIAPDIMVDPNPAKITCATPKVQLYGTSATAGTSLLWTGPGSITGATTERPEVDAIGVYTLTVTNTVTGCISSATVNVTEDKTVPALPSILPPAQITCNSITTNLELSPVPVNADILWTTLGSGNILNGTTSIATVDAVGTYTVTVTDRTSGCTNQNSVVVTENKAISSAAIVGGPFEISCSSATLQLEGSTNTGINPVWTASSGGHLVSGVNTLKPTIDAAGTYIFTVTNPVTGCTSSSNVVVTQSSDLPTYTIDAFPDELTCSRTQVTLSGQPAEAGTTFTWTASPGNIVSGGNSFNPIVDQPGSYILTVTKTATGCNSVAAITVVQNITPPSAVIAVPEEFTCTRTQVQLSGSSTNNNVSVKWTTSGTGNIKTGDDVVWNPIVYAPATYTLTVTDNDNQCHAVKDVVVTENKALPNINVDKSPLALTCTRNQVILSGNSLTPGATYLWIGPGSISNPSSKNPAVNAPGTYTLKVTNPVNGCFITDNVVVNSDLSAPDIWVNAIPGVLNCIKDTVYLKGNSTTTNVTYLWSGPGNISSAASKEPYVDTPGVYTLTVTSVANGCISTLPVTVTQNLTVPASPLLTSNTACFEAPANALTAVGTDVQWYNNPALGSAFKVHSGNSYIPLTINQPGDYSFYATQTDPNSACESPASQVTYTISSLPAVPVNISKTICEGDPDKTLSVSGTNIKWYNIPGGAVISTGTFAPAVSLPGTYTYYTTQTDVNGCESPAKDITLTIQANPAKPIVNQLTGSICFGNSNPVFTASGNNLKWYVSSSLPAPVKEGASFIPLETTTGSYSYYVTQTSSFGCVSPYETVVLNIRPLPQLFSVTGGGVYCENTNGLTVGLSGSQLNTSYQLLLNGTTVVTSLTGTGGALDFGLQKGVGNYTVKAIDNNACEVMMTGGVSIVSNPLPGNAPAIAGLTSVCEGGVNVSYSIPYIANAATYTWNVPSGAIITSGLNTPSITIDYLPGSITGQLTVTVSNACGTGGVSPNLQVIVNPLPVAAGNIKFSAGNNQICLGDSGKIYEVDPIANAASYEWELPTGATVYSGANSRQIRVKFAKNAPTGNHSIRVRGVNSCGAGTYSAPYNISIKPNPFVNAGIDQNLCSTQASLQGSAVPPGGNGIWNQVLGYSAIINNSLPNSQINDISQGLNIYTWKVTYDGCSSTDSVRVFNNMLDVDAGEDLPICSQNVILRGTTPPAGTSGIWTVGSGAVSFTNASQYNTSATSFGYGDNKLYWTVTKNGCQSRDSILITNYRPVAPDAGADQTICIGRTFMAASAPAYGTGQWSVYSGKATFADINDPKTAVTAIGKGKNILLWTVTNMICSLTDTIVVTNNELDVSAGYDQVVCENRATIEGTVPPTGSTGQWSVYLGSASFLDGRNYTTKVSGLVNGTNKLVWSITRGSCVNSDTVAIVCNMPTVANAGPDQFLANGSTILDGNNPVVGTGKWSIISGAANFSNESLYNTSVTGLNPGANVLRWTITYNGCNTFDEVTITNGTIEKVDAGQDQVLCVNQTTLEAARPQYGFGIWTVQKGSANFENNEAYNSRVSNLAPGTNILRWSVIVSGIEFYDTVTIVNNQPTAALTGPKQTLCIDSSALVANVPVQGTGRWTLEGGSGFIQNPLLHNSKVTGLSSGENIFRWTITKGTCVSSALFVITNDKTTIADAGLDQTICDDKTLLIPAPAYVGTGEWSVVSGSGSFTNNEVAGLARGTNVLRYTIRKNNCSSYDDMVVISNKPTNASAGLNAIVCADSLYLSANKANTAVGEFGRWSIMNGSGQIADSTLNTTLVKRLAQGVNVLRWTINNHGCISSSDVQVNYAHVNSVAGIDLTTCENHIILNANNPTLGKGEWSVVGGSGTAVFTDPFSPNTEVKNLDQGKNILRWTISNFSCYSSSEVIITNNAPSAAFAGGDQSLCLNNTTLAARQPFIGQGSWSVLSGSGLFTDTAAFNSRVYNIGSGPNTYRWSVRNENCISIDEVVINNNRPIGTYAGLDQTLCIDSAKISANQPIVGAGVWSITKGAGQIIDVYNAATSIQKLAPDTNVLRWTVSYKQCIEYQEIKLVNNAPTIPLAGADRTLCSDQTLMDGNNPIHGTGEWQVISGSGTFTNKNVYNTEVKGLTLGRNIFRWKISKQGCIQNDDVVITNDLPTKPNAGTDISVCDNNASLNANKPAVGTGYWSLVSGNGIFIDSTQYNTRIVGLGQGSNLLMWTTVHNRCSLSDAVDVKNNITNVYAGPDQIVFENSSMLVGNEPLRGIGTWSLSGGNGAIATPNEYESVVTGLAEGVNTFIWSVDISGCKSSDAVQITYYRLPTASFSVNQLDGCPPLEVKFTKTTIEKYPFKWYFGDKDSVSAEENPVFVYEKPGKYSAKLQVTGPDGKPVEMVKSITVRELPVAKFDIVNPEVYIPNDALRCFNYSIGARSYLWHFGDGETSDELNPAHIYKDSGYFSVKLKVWSEYNCVDSLTIHNGVHVIETSRIKFPSAFTPNENGPTGGAYNRYDYSNDVFYPILINGEIENYHLEIYNRWGVLIFESNDVNIGWDGYYKEKLMKEDIYIYRLTGRLNNGRKINITGDFLLMRRGK